MREKLAEFLDALMGFRKFIAFLLILAIGIVFRIINLVNGSEFVDLEKAVGVSFMATNSVEHFTTMVRDYIASRGANNAPDDSSQAGS
jgi:hypothetical protein